MLKVSNSRVLGLTEKQVSDIRRPRDMENGLILSNVERRLAEATLGLVGEAKEFCSEVKSKAAWFTLISSGSFMSDGEKGRLTSLVFEPNLGSKCINELGDLIWYTQELHEVILELGLTNSITLMEKIHFFGCESPDLTAYGENYYAGTFYVASLPDAVMDLADATKKYLMYRDHALSPDKPLFNSWNKAKETLVNLAAMVFIIVDGLVDQYSRLDVTFDQIVQVNTDKLKERFRFTD